MQVVSLPPDHPVECVQLKKANQSREAGLLSFLEQLLPWPQEKETPSDRRVGLNNGICLRRSLGSTEFTFTAALQLRERNLSLSHAEVDIDVAESSGFLACEILDIISGVYVKFVLSRINYFKGSSSR